MHHYSKGSQSGAYITLPSLSGFHFLWKANFLLHLFQKKEEALSLTKYEAGILYQYVNLRHWGSWSMALPLRKENPIGD